jgi:hypothetical protein
MRCESTPEVELAPSKLYGWDYMDIVRGKNSRRRQLPFDGNWRQFTDDVVVLFGQKLGDIIKPAPGISICRQWDPIPSRKTYLTATIDCLRQLSWERGGHRDSLIASRLTNEGNWNHRTNTLFVDCGACNQSTLKDSVRCLKIPQRLDASDDRRFDSLVPPSEGAIVFGSHSKALHRPIPASLRPCLAASGCEQQEHLGRFRERVRRIIGNSTVLAGRLPASRPEFESHPCGSP